MDFFIGTILAWPLSWAPQGWLLCEGQLLPVNQNQALYSLIGTTYGGNGVTTFGLPDLRGRVILGAGNGTGLTPRVPGQAAGAETATLSQANLAPHMHAAEFTGTGGGSGPVSATLQASSGSGTTNNPAGNYLTNAYYPGDSGSSSSAVTCNVFVNAPQPGTLADVAGLKVTGGGGITGGIVAVGLTGGGEPVGIMPPFLTLNFIIAIEGLYPPRP